MNLYIFFGVVYYIISTIAVFLWMLDSSDKKDWAFWLINTILSLFIGWILVPIRIILKILD